MPKFIFLILHYYTYEDTVKCIETIEKIKYKNIEIVIVDNGSKNYSGILLQNKYKDNEKIHIILSEKNLGFANGNNLGFKYAKEQLNADFIVMCNNDVYMLQDNFCEIVNEEYENSKFAILGPRILLNNNKVYDYMDSMPSLKELKIKRITTKIYYYLNKIHLRYIYAIFFRIFKLLKKTKFIDTSIRKEDVPISGCCIIFSQEYIKKFDGIDNRTFLYYEEPLLYLRLKENKMKSVYNPYIMVFHNEGVSTRKTQKNKREKFNFVLKCEIESLEILIFEIEKNYNGIKDTRKK